VDTIELTQINKALDVEHAITAAELRAMKPMERKLRAARLVDLHERRIRVFTDALDRMNEFTPPVLNELIATALAQAIQKDRESIILWSRVAISG